MDEIRPTAGAAGPPARARNPGIDLLRGLSILLVVMHHTAIRIPLEKGVLADWLPQWLLYGVQYDGFESVFLFFVISGFLITSNSLAIEEVFYLAFPVACLLLGRTRLLVPALLALALSIPLVRAGIHHDEIWAEENDVQGMAAIATGVLASLLVRRWPTARMSTVRWTTALGVTGLLAVYFAGTELWQSLRFEYMLVLTFSAAALVIASRWRAAVDATPPLPAFGWLRSFGRLSYEIYLTHMFVVWLVVDRFDAAGGDLRMGAAWYPPVLAGAWALGWLVARLVSNPLERLLLRASASRAPARANAWSPKVSA